MSIEEAMMGGIVFKGKKDNGSASAKMKAEIRRKRANRHKK